MSVIPIALEDFYAPSKKVLSLKFNASDIKVISDIREQLSAKGDRTFADELQIVLCDHILEMFFDNIRTAHLSLHEEKEYDSFDRYLFNLYSCYPHNLKKLANYGWFAELGIEEVIPEILNIRFDDTDIKRLTPMIINHYEANFNTSINELSERYPKRKNFFVEDIAGGYNDGHIRGAILCILTQIDGICYDQFGKFFFKTQRIENDQFVPALTSLLLNVRGDLLDLIISPLLGECPIFTHSSRIQEFPSNMNRHTAMHGIDVDYGGKEDFWKCFSLLMYVSDVLFIDENYEEDVLNLVITT